MDEVGKAGHSDGVLYRLVVPAPQHPQGADVGKAALFDQFHDSEFGGDLVDLGQDGHLSGDLAGGEAVDVLARKVHGAPERRDQARQGLEGGALSRPVGTHQSGHGPVFDGEAQPAGDHMAPVAGGDPVDGEGGIRNHGLFLGHRMRSLIR